MAAAFLVRKSIRRSPGALAAVLLGAALAGCATPPAKDFGGGWRHANGYPGHPTEIPLHTAYTFYAAPMDVTLKAMLARWARDTQRDLTYRAAFDVTLYTPVSTIRSTDIDTAVADLNRIYAAQHLHVAATDRAIVVGPAGDAPPTATAQAPAIATAQAPPAMRRP